MEFFAGSGRCTSSVRMRGNPGCPFDILYNPTDTIPPGSSNYMDINGVSGFACLD